MARFFDQLNENGEGCPLCGTKEQGQVILCPTLGTEQGNIMQAKQVHRRCAEVLAYEVASAILEEEVVDGK